MEPLVNLQSLPALIISVSKAGMATPALFAPRIFIPIPPLLSHYTKTPLIVSNGGVLKI